MREPKFARRHYEAVAKVMSDALVAECNAAQRDLGERPSGWRITKGLLGDMFAADNPRFNRGKFEEACEP